MDDETLREMGIKAGLDPKEFMGSSGKVNHIYVKVWPVECTGTSNIMWIHEDANLQFHFDKYDMHDAIHIGDTSTGIWPKDYPISMEDIDYHTMKDGQLVFCPHQTKKTHLPKLRAERELIFKDLDAEFMKNLEKGKDNSDVYRRKQILRDMPTHPFWSNINSLSDIKSFTLKSILSTTSQ